MDALRVSQDECHGTPVVKIAGTLDSRNDILLESAFAALEARGTKKALVDLSGATHVSSAGWSWILGRHRLWKREGREFAIVGMSEAVRSTFDFLELGFSLLSAKSPGQGVLLLHAEAKSHVLPVAA